MIWLDFDRRGMKETHGGIWFRFLWRWRWTPFVWFTFYWRSHWRKLWQKPNELLP